MRWKVDVEQYFVLYVICLSYDHVIGVILVLNINYNLQLTRLKNTNPKAVNAFFRAHRK